MKLSFFTIAILSGLSFISKAQPITRADSLRGSNQSPYRNCYDINYYHLDVKVNIDQKFISGSNLFKFTATSNFNKLQFDLFANLKVERVLYKGQPLKFKREFNAVFVTFPKTITKGSKDAFTVYYSGKPTVAKNAPWDGGFVFSQDAAGKPWIATACEGVGASIWWPNKDQTADEVDSLLISVSVPKGLKDISNGRLRKTTELKDGYTRFDWFVANPINNYDVALNIANYQHISDSYNGEKGKLSLDYWVLPENVEKAKKQFGENVKPMLKAFEHWFGPYPFYEDGYKLIETPHLGMEHQSAVAYGNKYVNGYKGTDRSLTGWGLKWDFIIIHESGHEWFGNNITMKDIADEWIHESFTTYSESLFVEDNWGKQAGQEYLHGQRHIILNDRPIIGTYNVNRSGSSDEYDKGSNMLNAIRTIINNDAKWLQILRGLNKTFYHQTVTTADIVGYINKESGINLSTIFDQYLHYKNILTLEFRFDDDKVSCRWIADVDQFAMPVRIRAKGGEYQFISPSTRFKVIDMPGITKDNLEVDTFNYYIGVLVD
jgi:aminopeptidase N